MSNGLVARAILAGVGAAVLDLGAQASAAGRDGVAGATSTGSIRITASVAATGKLNFVHRPALRPEAGAPVCLWLNSGTGQYRLTALPREGQETELRWQVGSRSAKLRPGAVSAVFEAPTRPSCRIDELASLSVGKTSAQNVTLIVAPE